MRSPSAALHIPVWARWCRDAIEKTIMKKRSESIEGDATDGFMDGQHDLLKHGLEGFHVRGWCWALWGIARPKKPCKRHLECVEGGMRERSVSREELEFIYFNGQGYYVWLLFSFPSFGCCRHIHPCVSRVRIPATSSPGLIMDGFPCPPFRLRFAFLIIPGFWFRWSFTGLHSLFSPRFTPYERVLCTWSIHHISYP